MLSTAWFEQAEQEGKEWKERKENDRTAVLWPYWLIKVFVDVNVDVDVMMSGLVPFLLCPLLQGPCVGPLRPEANFLRRTPSTWRIVLEPTL